MIQSAEAVFDRALAAGRTPSRVEKFGEHDQTVRDAVRDTLRVVRRDAFPKNSSLWAVSGMVARQ